MNRFITVRASDDYAIEIAVDTAITSGLNKLTATYRCAMDIASAIPVFRHDGALFVVIIARELESQEALQP